MKGWKTWAGAAIIGVGAGLEVLGYGEVAKAAMAFGGALGIIGVGHKIEKSSKTQKNTVINTMEPK